MERPESTEKSRSARCSPFGIRVANCTDLSENSCIALLLRGTPTQRAAMDDDARAGAIALRRGLGDDLRIVGPQQPGRRVLDGAGQLRHVGPGRRIRRRTRPEPAPTDVAAGARQREVTRELEWAGEWPAAVDAGNRVLHGGAPILALRAGVVGDDGTLRAILRADEKHAL